MHQTQKNNRYDRYYALLAYTLLLMVMLYNNGVEAQATKDKALDKVLLAKAASRYQDHASLKQQAKRYLMQQALAYPGEVNVRIGSIDSRLKLPLCPHVNTDMPNRRKAWGKTSVRLSCASPRWQIYVQAEVKVIADYLIAAMPLATGQIISANDVTFQKGDLTQLPAGIYTDVAQVAGRTVSRAMAAGTALSQYMVKVSPVIQQGQAVMLVTAGHGFSISAEGKAIGKALEGQVVQVKVRSGQVVSGIARQGGKVEVTF